MIIVNISQYKVHYNTDCRGNHHIVLTGTNLVGSGVIIATFDDYQKGKDATERFGVNLLEAINAGYRYTNRFLKHEDERYINIDLAHFCEPDEFKPYIELGERYFNWKQSNH